LSWVAQVGTLLLDELEVLAGVETDHLTGFFGGVAFLVVGTLFLDELEVLAGAETDHLTGFLGGVAFLVVGAFGIVSCTQQRRTHAKVDDMVNVAGLDGRSCRCSYWK